MSAVQKKDELAVISPTSVVGGNVESAPPPSWGRDNYKKWPWSSFLIAAVSIGSIFFIAGSPLTITQAKGIHLGISIGFLVVGSILLVPSFVAVIVLIWIAISNATGCCLPFRIRQFIRLVNGKPPLTRDEEEKQRLADATESEEEVEGTDDRPNGGLSTASAAATAARTEPHNKHLSQDRGHSNHALERELEDDDEMHQMSFSRSELVLNVNEDPISSQRHHGRFIASGSVATDKRLAESYPLEDVGIRRELPSTAGRATSIRTTQSWAQFSQKNRRNGSATFGPSTSDLETSTTGPEMRNSVRKPKSNNAVEKPTLLSLSQSYVTQLQSSGSLRGNRLSGRSASPQAIYVVKPQKGPVRDSVI